MVDDSFLDEAKKSVDKPKLNVQIHSSKEFENTFKHHAVNTPGVKEAMKNFIAQKKDDPLSKFGSKDYPLGNHFDKGVPGITHSGLTHDKSVFYTLSGSGDTRHIHLYGIYGHDEAGIGQPPNIKKQKSLAKKLGNQEFDD